MDLLIYNHFMHTLIFLTNSLLLFLIFSILALDFYLHFILHEAGSLSLVIKALDNVYIILQCPSRWKFELRILVSWWQLRIVREVSSCQNFLCIKSPIAYTNQLASATCHCSQWGKRRTQATRPKETDVNWKDETSRTLIEKEVRLATGIGASYGAWATQTSLAHFHMVCHFAFALGLI